MKRLFDLTFSIFGIILIAPFLIIFIFLIWIQDYENPFYIAKRIGLKGKPFDMYKLRSMCVGADKNGVDSTSGNDPRITKIGAIVRKFKIDELSQLINVLIGTMSFVGPRPNVKREIDIYTKKERFLLNVKPGITDFASIVFSDEGEILKNKKDPDLSYNQLIRPLKSKLGLFYVKNQNLILDLIIILLTIISFFSRRLALTLVCKTLRLNRAPKDLINGASRKRRLRPSPPPGSDLIVSSRTKS